MPFVREYDLHDIDSLKLDRHALWPSISLSFIIVLHVLCHIFF